MKSAFKTSVILVLSVLGCALSASAADALPRYKLQVGQELQYSEHNEFKYESGKLIYDATFKIWVGRQNEDGSWRLIVRSGMTRRQETNALLDALKRAVNPPKTPEDVTFAWCDFYPDGKLTDNDSLGYRLSLRKVFPPLPQSEADAKAGWSADDRRLSETYRCKMATNQSSPSGAVFEVVRESPMNEIYGSEYRDTVEFDRDRGLPAKINSSTKQTYGFNGEGHGTLQLNDVVMHDAQWCGTFAADADRVFAAKRDYERANSGDPSPDELEKALQKALAALQAAAAAVQTPELKDQLEHDIKKHGEMASYYLDEAKRRVALLGQPSADWSCSDLAGKQHDLKDYRGRVVVLDFWYRGCGWCIRAMPQVKEVAAYFKDKPVTIFGMNTDRQEDDAKFVIDKMALNYDNLKATGVPEKYKVQGFPTLIIIDQEGVVRDLHVGYSPDLKEKVIESIERRLAKTKP